MALRVGVDIGGTFTDVAIEDGEHRWSVKVPTTHDAPDEGVIDAVARGLAAAGRSLDEVQLLVHGTTLATNALIERKGARTALLTTDGFRDVLEMAHESRFDQYDLQLVKPRPIIDRRYRFTVPERMRHDGTIVRRLDEAAVRDVARAMAPLELGAIAVAFLHAYANGRHEQRARQILAEELGDIAISVSHEVSPEMREYERVSTTCANAYLQPVVSEYLLRLERRLQAGGLGAPMLMILSSGSLTTVETASRFPIRLLESGPAGGAIFACDVARKLDIDRVLSFDVGGTTAKFCMIDKGQAHHAASFEVGRTYRFKKGSGLPVRVPVVDLVEIGAGGGSIARIDSVGRVAVGPDSAGSEPGPACYGRGGTLPTITDCDLAQGKLDAASFAGGTMPLDAAAAETAISATISRQTGLSVENAAFAVTETMIESMASAARVHAAEIGTDIEDRTLVAFGGGAPLQAARFAEKLGIRHIVVPSGAGVGSAIGFLRAPLAYEIVRTVRLTLPGGSLAAVTQALGEMEQQAAAIVEPIVPDDQELVTRRTAYMRYVGQGHEIEIPLPTEVAAPDFGEQLYAAFGAAYAHMYGRALAGSAVEVTAWMIRVQGNEPPVKRQPVNSVSHAAAPSGSQRVFNGTLGKWENWQLFNRAELGVGAAGAGPAILSEAETTTVVPAGFSFAIDGERYIRLTREPLS